MPKLSKVVTVDPACIDCLYWTHAARLDTSKGISTCIAFYPREIPEEIWLGSILHDKVHKIQKGRQRKILYTPRMGTMIPEE